MKKIISAILVISLLLSLTLLSGCFYQEEILDDIKEEIKEEIKEAIKEEVKDIVQEEVDALKGSIKDGVVNLFGGEASDKYVWGFRQLIKKDWTPVLSSYYDNETVVIYLRHSAVGHWTYYMIVLFEGDTCTYYYGEKSAVHMWNGQKAKGCQYVGTFQNASARHLGLQDIYACTEELLAYRILVEEERRNPQIYNGKFDNSQLTDAVAEAGLGNTIDVLAGTDGIFGKTMDVTGKVMEVADYIQKACAISGSTKVDIIKENEDKIFTEIDMSDVAQNAPIAGTAANGMQGMVGTVHSYAPNISAIGEAKPELWTNLKSFEELGTTVNDVEFRLTETHLQYKYKDMDDTAWMDMEALDQLSSDGQNVVFQITDTHIQWRVLSPLEQALAAAQKDLHAAVKRAGKSALKD